MEGRYAQANWPLANSLLQSESWDDLHELDVNQAWMKWEEIFMAIMEACIPQSRLPKQPNLPWISKEVLSSMRSRNKWFKRAQWGEDRISNGKYKSARNRALKLLRASKKRYSTLLI